MDAEPEDHFDLVDASIEEIHRAYRRSTLTAERLVERYVERIDEYDEDLNAILTVNGEARRRASKLDAAFESEGFVGPLHGIPVVLKDNHDTHDLPTTAGSKGLAEVHPSEDAFVVEQIRAAGGIVLAKANLDELSHGVDTISSLGGETRNAYDLNRRPSGSSGGTAAAIAANLGTVGTGTDTCSSVRSPSAFNALVGVRPTRGLVSRRGIVPLSETQDTAGPIARTVTDAARLLGVMSGYDPEDPVTAEAAWNVSENGYSSHLDEDGLDGARIGVVRSLFGTKDDSDTSSSAAATVTRTVEDAIAKMEETGATVVDPVEIVDTAFLESASVITFEFKRDFDRYLNRLGDEVPYDNLEELVDSGEVTSSVASRIRETDSLSVDVESLDENTEYLKRLHRRQEIRTAVLDQMADRELDALVYPPSTIPPVEIPENQPFAELRCELSAHTGLPAVVVPAGFDDEGLPVGIELLGRPFSEPRLFELAYAYEQLTNHREPPSKFH